MSVIIGGMLILGGIGIIGVVSYAIYQGSKMTFRDPRKNERSILERVLSPIPLSLYALGIFCIYFGATSGIK
jgi:hypothetical protein